MTSSFVSCWHEQSEKRPTSDVIVKKLQAIGTSFQMSLPLQRMNNKGRRVVYDPGECYSMTQPYHVWQCHTVHTAHTQYTQHTQEQHTHTTHKHSTAHTHNTYKHTHTHTAHTHTTHTNTFPLLSCSLALCSAKVKQNKKFLSVKKRTKASHSAAGSREGTESSAASGRTPESSLGCEFIALQSQQPDQSRGVNATCACRVCACHMCMSCVCMPHVHVVCVHATCACRVCACHMCMSCVCMPHVHVVCVHATCACHVCACHMCMSCVCMPHVHVVCVHATCACRVCACHMCMSCVCAFSYTYNKVLFVFVSIPVTSNFSAPVHFLSENAVALSM